MDADININYMERNPQILQAIIDTFLMIFPFFRRSEIRQFNTVSVSASVPGSTDTMRNTQLINRNPCSGYVVAESSVPTKLNSIVKDEGVNSVGSRVTQYPGYGIESLPSEVQALFDTAPVNSEIYIEKILPLKNGYPMCFPQPAQDLPIEYRRKGVSIGDVGVITRSGGFDFLFNVLLPAQHPINLPACLPNEFDPVFLPMLRTTSHTSADPGDSKFTSLRVDSDLDMNTSDISFTCKDEDAGAILSLPHGASDIDMVNEWHWKQYIMKHALHWYRYARDNCGRDLDRHSLYFITGCMKSKTWGIATFNTSMRNRNSELVIGKSGDIYKPSYVWKRSGGASCRSSPYPDAGLDSENEMQDNINNQCLFLRGFKIALSEEMWNNLWDLTGVVATNERREQSHLPKHSHEQGNGKGTRSNADNGSGTQSSSHQNFGTIMSITHFPVNNNPLHPLNLINNMLLSEVPDACIAITHDNVWCEVIRKSNWDVERLRDIIREQYAVRYYGDTRTCLLEPKSIDISASRERTFDSDRAALKSSLHDSHIARRSIPVFVSSSSDRHPFQRVTPLTGNLPIEETSFFATNEVSISTSNNFESDFIILLLGETGVGKSSFINCAAGREVAKVGHDLISHTKDIRDISVSFPHNNSGRKVILVDTPGFNSTFDGDEPIIEEIMKWLTKFCAHLPSKLPGFCTFTKARCAEITLPKPIP
ncbi:hypothetical protein BDQ17DRAFT_154536 [Cyathus striatus]|nr:hypothetical protein BDQ17DRAFT_154536 [Cyathus striatus]